jgi:hypothetical protein
MTGDGKLTTTDFSINVNVAACSDGDISADEDTDILKDLIEQVQALEDEIETKLENGEFNGEPGPQGPAGAINFIVVTELPTENIDESAIYMVPVDAPNETNTYEEFIYVNGAWESIGTTSVGVDMTDYIKKTDYASSDNPGVVKVDTFQGTLMVGKFLSVYGATTNDINNKDQQYRPITPKMLDYAVKQALAGTTKKTTWSESEKAAARELLGISGGSAKQPISIVGMCPSGIQYVNQPIAIDDTKIYNTSLQLAYDDGSWTSMWGCEENATFTDGVLTLNLDPTGEKVFGVKIYANKVYDTATQTFIAKDGWLCVESQLEPYPAAPHHYVVVLTEA